MHSSEEETGDGEGVEVVKNEPYDNTDGKMDVSLISNCKVPRTKGQYTLKHYHFASRVPGYLSALCPSDSMMLVEEAWNAYPHCVTVLTSAYLSKERFFIYIESNHLPDRGDHENALGIPSQELKQRQIDRIDIAHHISDYIDDRNKQYDPRQYVSTKTGRGPLGNDWEKKSDPIMTCYKLVRTNFQYWGFQSKIEELVVSKQRRLFWDSMRRAHCMTDEWHGLDLEAIRQLEGEAKQRLDTKRSSDTSI